MASPSVVKAFLCSQDGTYNFPLMPKLTTIGRDNCDILIINNSIDLQHAVIEFNDEDSSFTIHDLNSLNGTFVNDCRLTNASTLLTENDTVKFGFNGQAFQLCIQQQQQPTLVTPIPPIGLHRQSYNHNFMSTLQQRTHQPQQQQQQQQRNGFFLNNFNNSNTTATTTTTTTIRVPAKPGHASLRQRPSSSQGVHSRKEAIKINSCIKDLAGSESVMQSCECRCRSQCGGGNGGRVDSGTYRQESARNSDRLLMAEREIHEKEVTAKNAEIKQLKETVSSSSIKAMIKELLKIKELINLLVSF